METTSKIQLSPAVEALSINPDELFNMPSDVTFCLGFGVDSKPPLRILSYPILGYELLKLFPGARLELYITTEFSSMFGISAEEAASSLRLMTTALTNFSPLASNRLSIVETTGLSQKREVLIGELTDILRKDPELRVWAQQRSGEESLRYLAAHALYMRDPLPVDPNLYLVPPTQGPVVMIGGKGETTPWQARKVIQLYFETPAAKQPKQLFTRLGQRPPYFRVGNEPEIGQEVAIDFLLRAGPEVYRDYASLLTFIANWQILEPDDLDLSYEVLFQGGSAKGPRRSQFLAQPTIQLALEVLNETSRYVKT